MTLDEVADHIHVSTSAVRSWIRKGRLKVVRSGGTLFVPYAENSAFLSARLQVQLARPTRMYVPPEISRYSKWHSTLDEISWVLKAAYSDPEDLKRKRFRLDILLAHYISKNKVSLADARREFRPTNGTIADNVWQDLQRGWYNELAFSFPPRSSTLGLSFQDVNTNEEATANRFLFPSWRITTAYYAIYFFLRAITRLKQPVFRLEEHGATLRNFKSCALRPLERTLWHFPLNVAFYPNRRQDVRAIPQLRLRQVRFNYARHPRPPHHSPAEAYRWLLSVFRHHARDGSSAKHYTLFDYLHDFRVWANYLEIEHLLNLRGPGYKAFLDQSLATILFFVGGIAELVFLACTSETVFRNQCQRFFEVVAASSTNIADKYSLMPPAQRLEVYTQLDLMRRGIEYPPKPDPNRVQVRTSRR